MVIQLLAGHQQGIQKTVQISSFGKFSLSIDGCPIAVQDWKSPKVYQLLLFIVAAGGENIAIDYICDHIWPDQEADNGLQNFEFILRRLRQILQKHLPQHIKANHVVQLQHGKISLNKDYCEMDSWHCDQHIKQVRRLRLHGSHSQTYRLEQRMIKMIQGRFLDGETAVLSHHHAWHTRICNWIDEAASYWQKNKLHHAHTIDLLDVGLTIDPYSERLLHHRIKLLHQAGFSTDAIRYYREWASMLRQTFGLQPSKASEQVYRAILSA